MLDTRMINRDEFSKDVLQILSETHTDDDIILKGIYNDEDKVQVQSTPAMFVGKIPDFHLEVSPKKWGKLKTDVLRVNCALEEAEALKTHFSRASKMKLLPTGVFIPIGLHLMAGAETMSSILTEHIQFMSDVRGIPITGFSEANMNTIIGDTTKTVKEHIRTMDKVVSIEMTRDTRYTCKWI